MTNPKDIDPKGRFTSLPGEMRPAYVPSRDGPRVEVRIADATDPFTNTCQACDAAVAPGRNVWLLVTRGWVVRWCDACLQEIGQALGMGALGAFLQTTASLSAEDARLLKTILDDYAETFEDTPEEDDRVALARRVAAALATVR